MQPTVQPVTPLSAYPAAKRTSIAHDELMALPVLRYGGSIRVVATDADLRHALHELRRERVLGFDTESRPTFRKGQAAHPPCLVQLAGQHTVYLFQLQQLDCSAALSTLLGNAHIVKTGVALSRDLLELRRLFPCEGANLLDLGDVAKKHGYKQTGVRNLTGLFLDGRITKGAQTSNWAQPKLSESQLRYAATDAWVCRELYLRFEKLGLLTTPVTSNS